MTAAASAQTQPPEAELQFDIGSTDDSLERMIELFARLGDIYRVFVPARGSYTMSSTTRMTSSACWFPTIATTPRAWASIA